MKTVKLLSVLLVLLFAANSVFAGSGKGQETPKAKFIVYEVRVTNVPNFPGTSSDFKIAIINGGGNLVAAAQRFHNGVWTYTFKETADMVKGQRIAIMVQYPASQNGWIVPASAVIGTFYWGNIYRFYLTPIQYLPPSPKGG